MIGNVKDLIEKTCVHNYDFFHITKQKICFDNIFGGRPGLSTRIPKETETHPDVHLEKILGLESEGWGIAKDNMSPVIN